MSRKNVEDIYGLSPLQQGMLFHTLLARETGAYVDRFAFLLSGHVSLDAVERAFQRLVERHTVLRTAFIWENVPQPVQVVFRQAELPCERLDWRHMDEAGWTAALGQRIQDEQRRGFDLKKAPLLRLLTVRVNDDRWALVLFFHHVLVDGWALSLLFGDWCELYRAEAEGVDPGLPPARPYRDYIAWLARQDEGAAERFWGKLLRGFTAPTPLPMDKGTAGTEPADFALAERLLTPATQARLNAFARERALTPNTVLQGAWALLLSRFSGEEDVVFGTTVSGRPADLPGVQTMAGLFINTLPVRLLASPEAKVGEWLAALQRQLADGRSHEYARLVDIQGWSGVPRELPLFESLLVFENIPLGVGGASGEGGDIGEGVHMDVSPVLTPQRTNYPLVLVVQAHGDVVLRLTYDPARFTAAAIERLLAALHEGIESLVRNADGTLADVSLVTEEDRKIAAAWTGDALPPYDRGLLVHQLFEARAAERPDAVAIVHNGRETKSGVLGARASQIAHRLRAAGVGPESVVGVCLERDPDLVAAILGVLKAGGAYLPLDPAYPADRLGFMLRDAGARVLLTSSALADRVPAEGVETIVIDDGSIDALPAEGIDSGAEPRNLAYVIYTSGSTGRPKGVAVTHASAVAFLHWMRDAFALADGERVLASSSVSFDAHVAEVHFALAWGHPLLLVENALSVAELSDSDGAAMASMVPTAAAELLRAGRMPSTLRILNLGGEALSPTLVEDVYANTSVDRIGNGYGPTEDTTYSTFKVVERGGRVTLGRPISGTRGHVLDARLSPVPAGAPGELYLAGAGLSRGYLGRPGLTAERFLPDPFSPEPGARMYRTGDLVRLTEDGEAEYLGRTDFQVKIRGFRIELGEIEETLLSHPAVASAAVVARDVDGDKQLVAYVVPVDGSNATNAELRDHLRATLPEHMVPAAFVTMAAFPLTESGKIDRRALPAPDAAALEQEEFVAPRTETEAALAEVWRELLKVERVGAMDSFFALGGHSVLAMRLLSAMRARLGVEVPLRALFESPVLADLAGAIDMLRDAELARLMDELEGMSDAEASALLDAEGAER